MASSQNQTDPSYWDSPLHWADSSLRAVCLAVHLFYFIAVLSINGMRKMPLVYVHNLNLVGLLLAAHLTFYLDGSTSWLGNESIERLLCSLSEILWPSERLMRSGSVALLSAYRYIAVFHIRLNRYMNRHRYRLLAPILIVWLFSIVVSVAIKFALGTTTWDENCEGGYSSEFGKILAYFLITDVAFGLVPLLAALAFCIIVMMRLRSNSAKFSFTQQHQNSSRNLKQTRRERNQVRQLFFINLCIILSSLLMIARSFFFEFSQFNSLFRDFTSPTRKGYLLFESSVPVLSLVYNPAFRKGVRRAYACLRRKSPSVQDLAPSQSPNS
nr:G protein-coupled receptor [Proales similis]